MKRGAGLDQRARADPAQPQDAGEGCCDHPVGDARLGRGDARAGLGHLAFLGVQRGFRGVAPAHQVGDAVVLPLGLAQVGLGLGKLGLLLLAGQLDQHVAPLDQHAVVEIDPLDRFGHARGHRHRLVGLGRADGFDHVGEVGVVDRRRLHRDHAVARATAALARVHGQQIGPPGGDRRGRNQQGKGAQTRHNPFQCLIKIF